MPASETRTERADVLILGAGTAGAVAAIQAARAGARSVVVDRAARMGGTTTVGGVNAVCSFHAYRRQVIAGIGWEMVSAAAGLDGKTVEQITKRHPVDCCTLAVVHPELLSLVLEEAALAAGACLHYHEFPLAIEDLGDRWRVETVGHGPVRRTIEAREIIDCTGDAAAFGLLGLDLRQAPERQPGTLIFSLDGYDPDALDAGEIQRRYDQALADGRIEEGDFWRADKPFVQFLQGHGRNKQHVQGADSSTSESQTAADVVGRQSLLRLLRFCRTLPGLEGLRLTDMRESTAARETVRIVGRTCITEEDYVSGRIFDDAVCNAYWFIDVHTRAGVQKRVLAEGNVPTVPLSAMAPPGRDRILAAGRCVSSDRRANSALRIQATCMAMGQAAGAAAALATRTGTVSAEVPIDGLAEILSAHGAILPG